MGEGDGEGEADEELGERFDVEECGPCDEAARSTTETLTAPSIGTITFNGQS
jgi:hypothetical protein